MADFPELEIELDILTKPASQLKTLEDYFDRAYKGERGNDEPKSEFLLRKVEEYIQGIARRMFVEDSTVGLSRNLEKQVTENFRIRQRIDKHEKINELGDNDPTMQPQPKAEATPLLLKPATVRKTAKRKKR